MKHNFFTHLSALLFIGAVLAFASSAQADSKYYIEKRQATITINVNGRGSVEGALSCSWVQGRCAQTFQEGAMFALKAVPEEGYAFSGWSSLCGNPQLSECLLQASRDMSLTATFSKKTYPLSLSFGGTGSGRVEVFYGNSPLAFPSSGSASLTYPGGAAIKLVVVPAAGSLFVSWGGACAGATGTTCMVEMNDAKSVSATLAKEPTPPPSQPVKVLPVPAIPTPVLLAATILESETVLTVKTDGLGKGTVTSHNEEIFCGTTCSANVAKDTFIILTAIPESADSFFHSWAGQCYDTWQNVCRVEMKSSKTITATFAPDPARVKFRISINMDGVGTVESNPSGIACGSVDPTGSICASDFAIGTDLVLTATQRPGSTSVFSRWEGACAQVSGNACTVRADASKVVTARFDYPPLQQASPLDVRIVGEGSVKSSDGEIFCGVASSTASRCSRGYIYGTYVILTAVSDTESLFLDWSSGCVDVWKNTCRVRIDGPKTITATFQEVLQQKTLMVVSYGPGSVRSDKTGIACGSDCVEEFAKGASVVLSATPRAGATFLGWNGACKGQESCTVTLDKAKFVYARFRLVNATLTVKKKGFGSVSSIPAGLVCGNVCSSPYPTDTVVTLYATPLSGQVFFGWEGVDACRGREPRCILRMDKNQSATAVFVPASAF